MSKVVRNWRPNLIFSCAHDVFDEMHVPLVRAHPNLVVFGSLLAPCSAYSVHAHEEFGEMLVAHHLVLLATFAHT